MLESKSRRKAGFLMHKSQWSQPLPYGSPTPDEPPHSARPESSKIDAPFNSRGLFPMDGEVTTVEHVLVCSSPNSPVLMVVSKDTSEGRVYYTMKVLEASTQKKSGAPTTSVLCICSTMTWGVRDIGPAIAKPPLPPPPHLQGGMGRQAVVSWPVSNTSQAVTEEPHPHQQRGMESHTASTPPRPPPTSGRYRFRLQICMQCAFERATMDYVLFNWECEQDHMRDYLYLYSTGCRRTAQQLPSPNKVEHDRIYVCWPSMLELNKIYVSLPRQGKEAALAFQQRFLRNACLNTMPGQKCIEGCLPIEERTSSAHPALLCESLATKSSFPWQDMQSAMKACIDGYIQTGTLWAARGTK